MEFVCPSCHGPVERRVDEYACPPCTRTYPVICGIPDFRLRPDRYLTLQQDRDKARRLDSAARSRTFDELVQFYYSITDDVPPALARLFAAYVRGAVERSHHAVDAVAPDGGGRALLDAGCGSGGLVAAAHGRFDRVVGLDIALRWLVIARKRLDELGIVATLVCSDVQAPPFAPGSFSHVAAADLLEHVYDADAAVASLARLLEPRGRLWLAASNKYCVGPHPLVRIWGVGYLPASWRDRLVRRLRGTNSLRHVRLTSPRQVRESLRRAGIHVRDLRPREIPANASRDYPRIDRVLMDCYRRACRIRCLDAAMVALGPAFEIVGTHEQQRGSGSR